MAFRRVLPAIALRPVVPAVPVPWQPPPGRRTDYCRDQQGADESVLGLLRLPAANGLSERGSPVSDRTRGSRVPPGPRRHRLCRDRSTPAPGFSPLARLPSLSCAAWPVRTPRRSPYRLTTCL